MKNRVSLVLCSLTAAMCAAGLDDRSAAAVQDEAEGLGQMRGVDDNMLSGGIGFFGNPPAVGVPGTKFTGPSLQSPILQTVGAYPLTPDHEYAFKSYRMFGWPYTNSGFWIPRYYEWWHRVSVATTDKTLTFFNGALGQFTTNIKNGEIPSGRPMWMQGMYFRPIDVSLTDGTLTNNYANLSAANTTSLFNLVKLQSTFSAGVVSFSTNSGRDEQFRVVGVDRFLPGGGSLLETGSMSGTGIAAGYQVSNMSNGGPKQYPGLVLGEPIPLLPGRTFSCQVDFQAATVPAAVTLLCCVYGIEIVSANYK